MQDLKRVQRQQKRQYHLLFAPVQLVEVVTGTKVLTSADYELAAELLAEGRLVAVPTETVYGLASDATQESAVHMKRNTDCL